MTDLRIQMDLALQEKDYIVQGYVDITRQMVLDEINKFEEYLPAIQQHVELVWPKKEAPSYNPAYLYSREKRDEIIGRPVTEEITFEKSCLCATSNISKSTKLRKVFTSLLQMVWY